MWLLTKLCTQLFDTPSRRGAGLARLREDDAKHVATRLDKKSRRLARNVLGALPFMAALTATFIAIRPVYALISLQNLSINITRDSIDTSIPSIVVYKNKSAASNSVLKDLFYITITCAWVPGPSAPEVDTSYSEVSTVNNPEALFVRAYQRVQFLDGKLIETATTRRDQTGAIKNFRAMLDVLNDRSILASKECTVDLDKDTVSDCESARPLLMVPKYEFESYALSMSICDRIVSGAVSEGYIKNEDYDAQKASAWRQRVKAQIDTITR